MVAAVGAFATSGLNAMATVTVAKLTRANKGNIDQMKEHVVNTHTTNLREDIDSLKDSVLGLHDRLTARYEHADREHGRLWKAIDHVTPTTRK